MTSVWYHSIPKQLAFFRPELRWKPDKYSGTEGVLLKKLASVFCLTVKQRFPLAS
jgi:hypothetical protein